jgi:AraC family transcriptional regulator
MRSGVKYDLNWASAQSGLSSEYINRLFKAEMGETFVACSKRLILEQAAREIRRTSSQINDIASLNGFDRADTFNHAFKKYFGLSPSEYKNHCQQEFYANKLALDEVRIIRRSKATVIKQRYIGDYQQIQPAVFQFIRSVYESKQMGVNTDRAIIIYYDDPAIIKSSNQRAEICLEISQPIIAQNKFITGQIYGETYAVTIYRGHYNAVHKAFAFVADQWTSTNGHSPINSGPICIGTFLNNPRLTAAENLLTELAIPVSLGRANAKNVVNTPVLKNEIDQS